MSRLSHLLSASVLLPRRALRATGPALAFVTGLGLALAGTAAQAQDAADAETTQSARVANGQSFGAWTVTCEAVAMNETTCVLDQKLLRSSDRAFMAQLLAFWTQDGSTRYLAARVPMGAYLPAGFAIRPTEGGEDDIENLVWQSCGRDLCEALIELDDETLARLTEGDGQTVASYRPSLQVEPLVFSFSMAGIEDGLAALAAAAPRDDAAN